MYVCPPVNALFTTVSTLTGFNATSRKLVTVIKLAGKSTLVCTVNGLSSVL